MPNPSQPFSDGSPATAPMMSRLISNRSDSSASTVSAMPFDAACTASASSISVSAGTHSLHRATSYRGCSADSLTEIECPAAGSRPTASTAPTYAWKYRCASACVRAASPSMSKLAVKPLFSGRRIRFIASSMVRPITKISPIIFIAAPTACRTNGSPARLIRRRSGPVDPSPTSTRPTTSPQVAELTSFEFDLPACARQSASPNLSAISRSAVSGSGTRRNASASDSNATPSDEFSRYSWRNWFTQPLLCAARRSASSPSACPITRSRESESSAARSSNGFRTSGSLAR